MSEKLKELAEIVQSDEKIIRETVKGIMDDIDTIKLPMDIINYSKHITFRGDRYVLRWNGHCGLQVAIYDEVFHGFPQWELDNGKKYADKFPSHVTTPDKVVLPVLRSLIKNDSIPKFLDELISQLKVKSSETEKLKIIVKRLAEAVRSE